MNDDIKLPPLPRHPQSAQDVCWTFPEELALRDYARAAVEADRARQTQIIECIAQQWDGCIYEAAAAGNIDIGEAIRTAAARYGQSAVTDDPNTAPLSGKGPFESVEALVESIGAGQPAVRVYLDFAQVGCAGPFPVVDGRVLVPGVTIQDIARMAQPAASAEPTESAVLLDALSGLVNALRERHYGRMPDEVQAAYDKAWAIVFSSPVAAPVAQEPVGVLECHVSGNATFWPDEDAVFKLTVGEHPVYVAPVAAQAGVPNHLIQRLEFHAEDKANTAFARSAMREALEYFTPTPPAAGQEK